jgi:hypothetical protein
MIHSHYPKSLADGDLKQLRSVMLYDASSKPLIANTTTEKPLIANTTTEKPQPQPQPQPPRLEFRTNLNQIDSLFWCLYVMKHGMFKYDQLTNHFTAHQDGKRDEVMRLREGAKALKQSTGIKFTASAIETDIMSIMTVRAFQVLVHLNSLNAVFMNPHNRVYAEFISDAVSNKPVYLIKRIDNKTTRLSMTQATDHELTSLRATHYRIENVQKPMKAVSAYTVAELTEMCHTLKIQLSPKIKKQELYDLIVKKLIL